jgi:hypothetical protein
LVAALPLRVHPWLISVAASAALCSFAGKVAVR